MAPCLARSASTAASLLASRPTKASTHRTPAPAWPCGDTMGIESRAPQAYAQFKQTRDHKPSLRKRYPDIIIDRGATPQSHLAKNRIDAAARLAGARRPGHQLRLASPQRRQRVHRLRCIGCLQQRLTGSGLAGTLWQDLESEKIRCSPIHVGSQQLRRGGEHGPRRGQ